MQVVKRNDVLTQCNAVVSHESTSYFAARTGCPAEGTFSYVVQKIWNDLPSPESDYASLDTFQAALDHLNWQRLPFIARTLYESRYLYWSTNKEQKNIQLSPL